jgi:transposase
MEISRVGLDLAKRVIQLHAVDRRERVVSRRAFKRDEVLRFFSGLAPCLIGMEACAQAHDWGRKLSALGHTVKLIAPQHVKPYVQGQKNDRNDAAAICEAVSRKSMRFVPIKSVAQQDGQALLRIRSERVETRTALVNQIRGLMAEYGIVVATGRAMLRRALPSILEDADNGLSWDFRQLLADLYGELVALDERIARLDAQVQQRVSGNEDARRLLQVPGVGPLTAAALVSSVGDARHFKNGRQMAAFFGLVPRQHSSGGKTRLLGMHKRGDSFIRGLLVHGARSVQRMAATKTDDRSRWLNAVGARRHRNIATVAQANKTARIAWVILARGESYRASGVPN